MGRQMTRPWCTGRCWLTVCLAAATIGDARHVAAETAGASLPVRGEMVDADVPATYRLPRVGLCDPADVVRVAGGVAKPQAAKMTGAGESGVTLAIPPTSSGLTAQLLPAVQRGYNLAQRGAFFAARTEFIQVLRRVAQAKDAAAGTGEHSRQLAAGLRAMDESDDFVPQGAQLEGELNVRNTASSHRTPVLYDYPEDVMPHEAVALYHSYAQDQLARAAIDEQAGSMALHGLGKVYARLAERARRRRAVRTWRDDNVSAPRSMFAPTIIWRPTSWACCCVVRGIRREAVTNFERAINIAPSATAYHNLAVAQEKLGMVAESAANGQESQRLAAWERATGTVSLRAGVEWVSPEEMARVSQPAPLGQAATAPSTVTKPPTPTQSRWRF